MRRLRLAVLAALVLVWPANARARDWPDWVDSVRTRPTPVWASKADAVVLDDELVVTVDRSGRSREVRRCAVRVLGPTGASLARADLVYMLGSADVRGIEAWVLPPAGEVRHLTRRDAIDQSCAGAWTLYSEVRALTLAAADAKPGTVFAYETSVESNLLFPEWSWSVSASRPSLYSRFTLVVPPGATPVVTAPADRALTRTGDTWTWERHDVPADDPEALPCRAGGLRVRLVPGAGDATAGIDAARGFRTWADAGHWFDAIEAPQARITAAIESEARRIVGADRDSLSRIRSLALAVQATHYVGVQIGIARGWGYRPHAAGDVLAAGYGDCKDKANLLCALLRVCGYAAWMVSVNSRDPYAVLRDWPSAGAFDHCIVAVRLPRGADLPASFDHPRLGRLLAFDPTDPWTAFGDLPEGEQGSYVLLSEPDSACLARLPVLPSALRRRTRTLTGTLDADGRLEAHVDERSVGQAASAERSLRAAGDEAAYRRVLERWLAAGGGSCELSRIATVADSLAGTYELSLDLEIPLRARKLGERMLTFRPTLVADGVLPVLADGPRRGPIQLASFALSENVDVRLPDGFAPEELPAPVESRTDFGHVSATWTAEPGALRFTRVLGVEAVRLPPERWSDVRTFAALLRSVATRPVVLVRH